MKHPETGPSGRPSSLSETEKDRLRSLLFDSVAAEFAQPLSLIAMNRDYLQLHLAGAQGRVANTDVQESLDGIGYAVTRLNRLTNNCIDLMACLQGCVQPQTVTVDLCTLVRTLCTESAQIARMIGVTLTAECPETPVCVLTDRAMAERVLLNLLSNALRACAKGGTVRLLLQQGATGAAITVQDDGCGVSPAFAAAAFQPLAAAQRAREPRFLGGAGLGLYLCGEYCRLLGWQPEMTAGRGTKVCVHIPAGQLQPDSRLVFHAPRRASSTPSRRPAWPS